MTKPIPLVEWMPLDGLAQQWAAFVSHSTRERAFASARLAFTALEQETAARRLEEEAKSDYFSLPHIAGSCAFEQLQEAASSWLCACERLEEYRSHDLPEEEEQSASAVLELLAESYEHLLFVACLSVRLVRQLHAGLDEPLRVVLCPIEMLDQEGQP